MNSVDIEPFLFVGSLICAAMAVVSALRYKSRGVSAYISGAAFLVLGADMLLLRAHVPQMIVIAGCVVLVILLVVDFAARSAHLAKKDSQR